MMLCFAYKARDSKGNPVTGTIDARSQAEAIRALEREGKTVTDIRVGVRAIEDDPKRSRARASGVRRDEVISLASQLGVMLETGVTLAEALEAYIKGMRSGPLKSVSEAVSDQIHGGMPFSAAIEEYPRVFPSLMVTLLKASEASGKMAMMLGRIAEYLGKERRVVRQIRGALTYPLIMVTIAVLVTCFLVVWVLPRFARIYESRQAALPPLTRVVLGISRFMTENWIALLAGAAGAVGLFLAIRATRRGRRILDTLKLRLPVIGAMFTSYYLTRATRTLSTLLASGVPLLEAVRIVRGVTDNIQWEELWMRMEQALTGGGTVADVIRDSWLIPPTSAQMIAAGERAGRLPEVLDRLALATEADLDEAVKSATQLIEPAMIIFMGGTIGGIAIALLLPIFNVANVMAK